MACYRAGASLYFRAPNDISDLLVTSLTQQLGLSFAAQYPDMAPRSEVETFVSRQGRITDWHFDFMQNFTLQIAGTKRWLLYPGSIRNPVRGCTPQWNTADERSLDAAETQLKINEYTSERRQELKPPLGALSQPMEVVLKAGDMLYVPAGMWHRVECLEDSISINISVMGLSYAEFIGEALKQRLQRFEIGRSMIGISDMESGQLRSLLNLARCELELFDMYGGLVGPHLEFPRRTKVVLEPRLIPEAQWEVPEEETCDGRANYPCAKIRLEKFPLSVLIRLPVSATRALALQNDKGVEDEWDGDDCSDMEPDSDDGPTVRRVNSPQGSPPSDYGSESSAYADGVCCSRDLYWDEDPFKLTANSSLVDDSYVAYAVHSNFGGDEIASQARILYFAPPAVVPLMEWIRKKKSFSLRRAHLQAQSLSFETVSRICYQLSSHACGGLLKQQRLA